MAWVNVANIRGPTGATGSTGAQGPTGAPGVGFTWRGTWSGSTAYAINDCVQRTNQSYISTVANTGNDPASDVTHWNLMAAQGGTGPTGPSGTAGLNSFTITSASFTVPAIGATVTVTVNDATWAQLGEMVSIANAAGASLAGALQITNIAGNTLTLLNPQPPPAIPPADSTQAGLLKQLSGNTTDYVDGTNTCRDLTSAPAITLMRLRSFNAVGNPTFEVDQRNCGSSVTVGNSLILDRWRVRKSGAMTAQAQQVVAGPPGNILVPGTNFAITNQFLRYTLTAQSASLGAGDYMDIYQTIEGSVMRELFFDVHSVSVLVRTSVANLTVVLYLKDDIGTRYLGKLMTIPTTGIWTLSRFPSLPIFASGGGWSLSPGVAGYDIGICLACGSTYTAPAVDTWQTGNFIGAPGQSNFAASAVNTTFEVAFLQHEPGPNCTTLIDKPFTVNAAECLRYYQKVVPYGTKPLQGNYKGLGSTIGASSTIRLFDKFNPELAKAPTVTFCDQSAVVGHLYVDNSASYVVNSYTC